MAVDDLPRTIELTEDGRRVRMVDQRLLPRELRIIETASWSDMIGYIQDLAVRGAPALGVAGAASVAICASELADGGADAPALLERLEVAARQLAEARPTAVNLSWGVARALDAARSAAGAGATGADVARAACEEARRIRDEDEASCRAIGANGAALLPDHARILTHCNAGSLATAFYGTALGVVYSAWEQGKVERVYADETRPVGQGARLTVWELARAGVPVTLQCDDMAASLMAQGMVDAVVVGADRICANGDVANKIGTYGLAVLAHHHHIPLYVAAPTSTIDRTLADGSLIPIEQRDGSEVADFVPSGVAIRNPAFDVTPASLVSAIVTERGVLRAPYDLR
ncbi:MAG: S-methyl-5-thioribose-1-phosphate isomerase [Coriobacteriales bacterium]